MSVYRVIGIEASPYAVKVRAVMRYRRIAHHWVARMPQFFEETAAVRPLIMPVVQFPDGEYRTDSTPILLDLETRHPDGRNILPSDTGDTFLAMLVEDFADEWLTKALFHYRFHTDADAVRGAGWTMDDAHPGVNAEELGAISARFIERQRGRMALVGCTPGNAPLLEASYHELLNLLEAFVATDRFLFGSRPSLADFGLFGQLHTLGTDYTAGRLMREYAPRTEAWMMRLDDLSGNEGVWGNAGTAEQVVMQGLLGLIARTYLPYLEANAAALDDGTDDFEVTLDGHAYRQPVFRYHRKCRDALRARFRALDGASRDHAGNMLDSAGALKFFET